MVPLSFFSNFSKNPLSVTKVVCLLVVLLCFCITSCDQKGPGVKKDGSGMEPPATSSVTSTHNLLNSNLTVLYINNTKDQSDLFKLIGNNRVEKVIFQFLVDSSGNIGLYGFPGQNVNDIPGGPSGPPQSRPHLERGRFFVPDKRKLEDSKVQKEDLGGKNAVLGDLQLEQPGVRELRTIMVRQTDHNNRPGYEFILFTPVVQKEPSTGLDYVYYKIGYSSVLPTNQKDLQDSIKFKTFIEASVNPSPPRKTY